MKEIRFIPDRCVRCGACRSACVAEHRKNHGVYDTFSSLPMAPKRMRNREPAGPAEGLPHPVRCAHCDEAACMEACIGGAIARSDRVATMWKRCVGCFMCVMNCPYGAVVPILDKAVRCDECLFTEKPACVRACPQNAIIFGDEEASKVHYIKRWKERVRKDAPLIRMKD